MNPTTAALDIMGIGMASIIAVMVLFYFAIQGVDKLLPYKEENKDE